MRQNSTFHDLRSAASRTFRTGVNSKTWWIVSIEGPRSSNVMGAETIDGAMTTSFLRVEGKCKMIALNTWWKRGSERSSAITIWASILRMSSWFANKLPETQNRIRREIINSIRQMPIKSYSWYLDQMLLEVSRPQTRQEASWWLTPKRATARFNWPSSRTNKIGFRWWMPTRRSENQAMRKISYRATRCLFWPIHFWVKIS